MSKETERGEGDSTADETDLGNARPTLDEVLTLPIRALRVPLYSNAFYLMLNTGAGAILGAAFWLVAARYFPDSEVGLAAALIPLATFLASAATLGLGIGLIRFLPEHLHDPVRARQMVNGSFTLSVGLAAALALVFVAGAPLWTPELAFVRENVLFAVGFVLISAGLAMRPILSHLFVALRKAQYTFVLSLVSGLRVPLPILLIGFGGTAGIFGAFGIGGLLAALVGAAVLLPWILPGYRMGASLRFEALKPMADFSLGNHVATLVSGLLAAVLPVMVVELRSPAENAWFYIAWFLGGMLYAIPLSMSTSLFAEGSQVEAHFHRDLKRTLLGSGALLGPAAAVLWFAGDSLLALFGESYAVGGFGLLRWLVLASPFVLANGLYFTIVRVRKRVLPIMIGSAFVVFFTLGASLILLPGYGLEVIGSSFLLAQGLFSVAAVADILRTRSWRSPVEGRRL